MKMKDIKGGRIDGIHTLVELNFDGEGGPLHVMLAMTERATKLLLLVDRPNDTDCRGTWAEFDLSQPIGRWDFSEKLDHIVEGELLSRLMQSLKLLGYDVSMMEAIS